MKTTKCLNCGHVFNFKISEVLKDELGTHIICPKCNSSFDIEVKVTLTVQELIDELMIVTDKTKPVFGFVINGDEILEILPITMIDDGISDRLDINFEVIE